MQAIAVSVIVWIVLTIAKEAIPSLGVNLVGITSRPRFVY